VWSEKGRWASAERCDGDVPVAPSSGPMRHHHRTRPPPRCARERRRTRGEVPIGVDAQVCASEDEDRIHVAKHVKGEIDARSDLKGTEAVARCRGVPPGKIESSADLEEKKCDQERPAVPRSDRHDGRASSPRTRRPRTPRRGIRSGASTRLASETCCCSLMGEDEQACGALIEAHAALAARLLRQCATPGRLVFATS
jgi:hypothetical protein